MADTDMKIPDYNSGDDWQKVKRYMREHDEDQMKGYSDDIDALLTLDGLFSAVVTGFIVPAFAQLQEDNVQTSAELLRNISSQIQSFHSTPPLINSTFSPSPPSPFEAPNFARWVNALWFLSLILSLASAVLGIIAKQWIREYLAWDISNAPHRENIVIRQARRESWDTWHTTAFISAIPALLEVAVILFVIGLMIFTWNLDTAVAIVVIVAAALFLLAVIILTALPTVYKRCPYKSPTAWAFLTAATLLQKYTLLLAFLFEEYVFLIVLKAIMPKQSSFNRMRAIVQDLPGTLAESLTWRVRDLEGSSVQQLPGKEGMMQTASLVVKYELTEESPAWPKDHQSRLPDPEHALRELNDSEWLFRAFAWMLDATSDPHLVQSIANCVQSLHIPNILKFDGKIPGDQLAMSSYLHGQTINAIWYLASRACVQNSSDAYNPWPSLDNSALLTGPRNKKQTITTYLRSQLEGLYNTGKATAATPSDPRPMTIRYYFDQGTDDSESSTTTMTPRLDKGLDLTQTRLLGLFLASQIKVIIVDVLDLIASNIGKLDLKPNSPPLDNEDILKQMYYVRRRLAELLCALQQIVIGRWDAEASREVIIDRGPEFAYQEVLLEAWCIIYHHPENHLFDMLFPGFRHSVLDITLSRMMFNLTHIKQNKLKWVKVQPTEHPSIWVQLTKKYPIDKVTSTREDLHIYAWIVQTAIEFMRRADEPQDQLDADCLYHMASALQCAVHNKWQDAGSYHSLFWIPEMVKPNPDWMPPDSDSEVTPVTVATTLYKNHNIAFVLFAAAYDAAVEEDMIYGGHEDMELLRLTVDLPKLLQLA